MKKVIFILFLFLLSTGLPAAPCGGAAGRLHVNPNGSTGGFVANTALVSKTVTIETKSVVCDKAKINGNAQIKGMSEILGSTEINGSVQISDSKTYSSPIIPGNSIIIRSVVCQASQLNSLKVIDSTYYCNVDDPEPRDPGEAGKKTLLGVDSDGDGVRDDVEIWLNRNFSNTPQKSYVQELSAAKVYSKNISDSLRMKSDQEFLVAKWRERMDLLTCNQIGATDDFLAYYLDTKERLMAWIDASGASHGEGYESNKINCFDVNSQLGIVSK